MAGGGLAHGPRRHRPVARIPARLRTRPPLDPEVALPAELLLPLFALVLGLNALLVVAAVRSLWRSRDADAAPTWPSPVVERASPAAAVARPAFERAANMLPAAATTPLADVSASPPAGTVPIDAPASTGIVTAASESRDRASHVPAEGLVRTPALGRGATSAPAFNAPKPSGRAPRRRFALPPLDDDHDKVSRSIESFLSGGDASPAGRPATPADPVTVVVLGVALNAGDSQHDGATAASSRSTPDGVAAVTHELEAVLERTVRSTARTADRVSVDRAGRVRITLPGAGELAAHAYLRRIRAVVDPMARSSTPAARIVVATATDLDGVSSIARRRADRRFAAALELPEPAGDDELSGVERLGAPETRVAKPRASGD
jgi:hypothetical protein